jgi:hypothetical protein
MRPRLTFASAIALASIVARGAVDAQCGGVRFGPPNAYATNSHPNWVTIGDLNEDGIPDLLVSNNGSGSVSVLLGLGGGSFGQEAKFSGAAWSAVLGDFNGDGHLDVAGPNGDLDVSTRKGSVSILLGDGHGGLSPPSNIPVVGVPYAIAVGDFNRDGKLDLVVPSGRLYDGKISILLGDGTGSFSVTSIPGPGGGMQSVVVDDFNRDGNPDFAVTTSNSVAVYLGNGDGTFGTPKVYAVTADANQVASGDLNGDGAPDLAVTSVNTQLGATGGNVTVLVNDGLGGFSVVGIFQTPNDSRGNQTDPSAIVVRDLDLDGKADLAVGAVTSGSPPFFTSVFVYRGDGTGHFSAARTIPVSEGSYQLWPHSLVATDLTGVGSPDLVLEDSLNASVILNTIRGPFDFYMVTPCRVIDTRIGPSQPLVAGINSFFTLAGACGVPSTARSVSANATVVGPTQPGFIAMFPGDMASSPTSTINFKAGTTRANNTVLLLDGTCGVNTHLSTGTSHFVIDVNGYFQ